MPGLAEHEPADVAADDQPLRAQCKACTWTPPKRCFEAISGRPGTCNTSTDMFSPDETMDPREDDRFRLLRGAMVNHQLRERDIDNRRVLRAMEKVPRHLFVPEEWCWRAYEDCPLPIGYDQTLSQPYIVAKMLEALELDGHERVLDVGTGSGYQAAVLAELAREVWSIEIIPELAKAARSRLNELGYSNVQVITGDGSVGLPERAPFDAIVVAAASPGVPHSLIEQLSPSGRLVVPVGDRDFQVLRRVTHPGNRPTIDSLLPCAFVPLVGEEGWAEETAQGTNREPAAASVRV